MTEIITVSSEGDLIVIEVEKTKTRIKLSVEQAEVLARTLDIKVDRMRKSK